MPSATPGARRSGSTTARSPASASQSTAMSGL
jgi:hypothetical protein